MVVLPAATPVTTPVVASTVATPGVVLLQVPPLLPLELKLMVEPAHTAEAPLMVPASGSELTVTTIPAVDEPQLLVTLYVIIVVPADIPVTSPVAALTVALVVLELFQVPPMSPPILVKKIEEPVHTDVGPSMIPAFGTGLTVTVKDATFVPQPVVTV